MVARSGPGSSHVLISWRERSTTAPMYSHHNAAVSMNAKHRHSTTVADRPASAAAAPVTTIDSPSAMMMKPWQ